MEEPLNAKNENKTMSIEELNEYNKVNHKPCDTIEQEEKEEVKRPTTLIQALSSDGYSLEDKITMIISNRGDYGGDKGMMLSVGQFYKVAKDLIELLDVKERTPEDKTPTPNDWIDKEWKKLSEFIMDFYRGDADYEEIMLQFKSSLTQQKEAIEKECSDKIDKYRTGLLDELEELGYNKDAIERNNKEWREKIEVVKENHKNTYGIEHPHFEKGEHEESLIEEVLDQLLQ